MKTLMIFLLALIATTSVNAQDCSTCNERVQASLEKNATYQKLMDEGSQSGIYKATKMLYQQLLTTCGACLGVTDKETTQEMIAQLDVVINALKSDPNGLTFDTSDESAKPKLNSSRNAPVRKQPNAVTNTTPVYQKRASGGTMTSGNAN